MRSRCALFVLLVCGAGCRGYLGFDDLPPIEALDGSSDAQDDRGTDTGDTAVDVPDATGTDTKETAVDSPDGTEAGEVIDSGDTGDATPPICTALEKKCVGKDLHTCDATGSSETTVTCDVVCKNGVGCLTVVELAAGFEHSCARMSDGSVRCWGNNGDGQLGDGTGIGKLTPAEIPGLTGVTQITAGSRHTCARLADGTGKCWGANASGQLGDGTTTMRTAPVTVKSLTGLARISAGTGFTCAIAGSTVNCFGDNGSKGLGDGTTTSSASPVTSLVGPSIDVASGGPGGEVHACALLTGGTAKCWGNNDSGQLGNGTTGTIGMSFDPVSVSGLTGATRIFAGMRLSCALMSDKTVKCWGGPPAGALPGDGTMAAKNTPTTVTGVTAVTDLATQAESAHACARSSDNTLRCWGINSVGQLGDGTTTDRSIATITTISSIVGVAVGGSHTCAYATDGRVWCFGANSSGEIGDGSTINRAIPTLVKW